MKQIFISYSSKHRDLTRELASALEAQYGNGSVWWDRDLESRANYQSQIRRALDDARVVVVIWTAGAMVSDYVYAEAVRAFEQGKLVNVRPGDMGFRDIPEPFNIYHVDNVEDHDNILATIAQVWNGTPIPTRVPEHKIYFRVHRQVLIETKQRKLPAWIASPTELLQAKYAAVGYSDVNAFREELLTWSTKLKRLTAGRLIHGAGGLGKTRLLIDVAAQLRRQGWVAGFFDRPDNPTEAMLKQRWQALEQIVAHGEDHGVLLVIDYAESRTKEIARLTQTILEHEPHARRPIRLVLLARTATEWWRALVDEKPEVRRLFHDTAGGLAAAGLPRIDTAERRLQFFRHCLHDFGAVLREQGVEPVEGEPPQERMSRIASGEGFARPLPIQMEALLYLTSSTPALPGIHEQLRAVLGLERDHWTKIIGTLDGFAKRDLDRGAAQVTAVNGVPSRSSAERILMHDEFYKGRRTARIDVDPVYGNLAAVYGGPDGSLMHLEPDLIGEHQVATVGDIELIQGCLAWLDDEPEAERVRKRRALLTVLQRASLAEHGNAAQAQAKNLLQHLVKTRLAQFAPDLVAVMIETGGVLEGILTSDLDTLGDELLAALESALPLQTLALMDLALHVAKRREQLSRQFLADLEAQAELDEDMKLAARNHLSARLSILGIRLFNCYRQEEARAASQEAVDIRRMLAETHPDDFLAELAGSLNELGTRLSSLRRWDEALAASKEAVDLFRRLAEARPDAFRTNLAGSLKNLGVLLSSLGRQEEALAASQEAVRLYRPLAETFPDAFLPDLALSLNNLGISLSSLGRQKEALAASTDALAASREAVEIYKRLAGASPDAFLPDLAISLNTLGLSLSTLDRLAESLAATQGAVDLYRRLAKIHSDAFLPKLAISLNNLESRLSRSGRLEEGLAASQEVVDLYRQLTATRPNDFLPDLAISLQNLAIRLSRSGQHEEALAASQEAMDIRRRLAGSRPNAFLPDVAMSLNDLGTRLSSLGRSGEGLSVSQEAVDLYRRLAKTRPDAYLPNLADSLNNLGFSLSILGRHEEALAASQEAVDLFRRLAETRRAALPDLARSLNNLKVRLSNLGRREEAAVAGQKALAASEEVVDLFRRLAKTQPDTFLPDLATSLSALGEAHVSAGDHEVAAPLFEEGLTIIASFVERQPQLFGNLGRSLSQYYVAACEKVGNTPDQALLERIANAVADQGKTKGSAGVGHGLNTTGQYLAADAAGTQRHEDEEQSLRTEGSNQRNSGGGTSNPKSERRRGWRLFRRNR
jgi:hypothetical protein